MYVSYILGIYTNIDSSSGTGFGVPPPPQTTAPIRRLMFLGIATQVRSSYYRREGAGIDAIVLSRHVQQVTSYLPSSWHIIQYGDL